MSKKIFFAARALMVLQIAVLLSIQNAFCYDDRQNQAPLPQPGAGLGGDTPVTPLMPGPYKNNMPTSALSSSDQGAEVLLGHPDDPKNEVSSIRPDNSGDYTFTHTFNGSVASLQKQAGSNGTMKALESAASETGKQSEPTANAKAAKELLSDMKNGGGEGEKVFLTAAHLERRKKVTKVNVISCA